MPTEILLLGATGPAGLETLKRALAEPDVHVTVYARSPDKIPADLRASGSAAEKLTVLAPAGLEDVEALRQAVTQTRPDAVISLLGPAQHDFLAWMNPFGGGGRGRTVFADAYRVVLDGLRECGGGRPRRIYAMGTISIPDPRDRPSLLARLMVLAVWLVVHRAWRNVVSVGRFFDSLSSEEYADIQWTLFRLGAVVDGNYEGVTEGYVGDGNTTLAIRRSELAEWLVAQATSPENRWAGERPLVSSAAKRSV